MKLIVSVDLKRSRLPRGMGCEGGDETQERGAICILIGDTWASLMAQW